MKPYFILLGLLTAVTSLSAENLKIAMIPKGTSHVFWKTVEAGAREASSELGVDFVWKGPLKEDDRAQQIGVVQQFVASGVDAIALAPLDDNALRGPVRAAGKRNIPVVIFDSPMNGKVGKDFVSLVATDNFAGGQLAGQEMARLLEGKGKVVLLRYIEGSASTNQREEGFLDAIAEFPDITVTVSNRYGGASVSSAQDAAMNLLDRLREADGIFTPNESSTQGMLLALRQTRLAGKKAFIGFDTSGPLLAGLRSGKINALVAQNPHKMGYLAVQTSVAAIKGEPVEPFIDTGCALVTAENIDSKAIQDILSE